MTSLRRDWNQFWHRPVPAGPLGLFRLAFGLLVLAKGLMLFPDRAVWYSERGVLPLAAMQAFNAGGAAPRLALLAHVRDERLLTLFFLAFLAAALCLLLGLWTRAAAAAVFLGLDALHARDGVLLNAGDTLMQILAFYLLFADAGAACSLDRLRALRRGRAVPAAATVAAWPVRLMQGQVALVYLCTALCKASGGRWRDGTAVYYPLHLAQMRRFPVPWVDGHHLWLVNMLTHGSLLTEFALGALLWVPALRRYVLAAGVLLHLGIEYALNVPLFSFLMIATYLLFLTPADLDAFAAAAGRRLAWARLRLAWDGPPADVPCLVRFLDAFRLVTVEDRPPGGPRGAGWAGGLRVRDARGRTRTGLAAAQALAWRLPALWPVAPLLALSRPGRPRLGGVTPAAARADLAETEGLHA